jgi:hypothetical protein
MRIALLLLMITACNKGAKDDKVASCNLASMKTCIEYRDGNLALGTEHLAKLCAIAGDVGKFSETPCPTANITGTCQRKEGKDYFYQGFDGVPDLVKACTERDGKFAK